MLLVVGRTVDEHKHVLPADRLETGDRADAVPGAERARLAHPGYRLAGRAVESGADVGFRRTTRRSHRDTDGEKQLAVVGDVTRIGGRVSRAPDGGLLVELRC